MDNTIIQEGIKIQKEILPFPEKGAIEFFHAKTRCAAGDFFLHIESALELYVFVSGSANFVIEDECFTLEKGDLLIIPPNVVHVVKPETECEYERFYMLLPVDLFDGFSFDPIGKLVAGKKGKVYLSSEVKEKTLSVLYRLSDAVAAGGDQFLLYSLVLDFLRDISDKKETEADDRQAPAYFLQKNLRNILKYIAASEDLTLTVADLAEKFSLSKTYLSAYFKRYVGISPVEYLSVMRIARAKRRLEEGGTITEVCYECGFADVSYFIKRFKSAVGMTPNKYRAIFEKKKL